MSKVASVKRMLALSGADAGGAFAEMTDATEPYTCAKLGVYLIRHWEQVWLDLRELSDDQHDIAKQAYIEGWIKGYNENVEAHNASLACRSEAAR